MNSGLHFDMCDIRDPSLFNSEVQDLQERLERYISESLRYSCKFWAVHFLEYIRGAGSRCQVPLGLDVFCDKHLLHWIEVLSLIESLDAVQSIMLELSAVMKVSLVSSLHLC
jgi:hypothetical protein